MAQHINTRYEEPCINLDLGLEIGRFCYKTDYLVMEILSGESFKAAERIDRTFIIHLDGNPKNCNFINLRRANCDKYYRFMETHYPPENPNQRVRIARIGAIDLFRNYDPRLTHTHRA